MTVRIPCSFAIFVISKYRKVLFEENVKKAITEINVMQSSIQKNIHIAMLRNATCAMAVLIYNMIYFSLGPAIFNAAFSTLQP